MNIDRIIALFGAVGTATTPLLAFLGVCAMVWDRQKHRRWVLLACPGCAEKLKPYEPPKVTTLLVVMGVCYAVNVFVAAHKSVQVAQQAPAMTPAAPDMEPTLEAATCNYDNCEKKTGCRCVSDQCRCSSADELVPPPPPPKKKPAKKKPTSALARVLPKMAGGLQPPWFANLPPATAPLAPSL